MTWVDRLPVLKILENRGQFVKWDGLPFGSQIFPKLLVDAPQTVIYKISGIKSGIISRSNRG